MSKGYRVRRKVDGNQPSMVAKLRKLGLTVACIHELGKGRPDIIVAYKGNWLIEIKDPDQPPSKRRLTDDEQRFHDEWKAGGGQVDVALTVEDVLFIIGWSKDS